MPFILNKLVMLPTLWMRNFKLHPSSGRLCVELINVKLLLLTEGHEYDIRYTMSFMEYLKRLKREPVKQGNVHEQRPIAFSYTFFFIIDVLIIILQLLTLESELAINFLWTFEMSWSDADIPF